jgi:hypothetical protein
VVQKSGEHTLASVRESNMMGFLSLLDSPVTGSAKGYSTGIMVLNV